VITQVRSRAGRRTRRLTRPAVAFMLAASVCAPVMRAQPAQAPAEKKPYPIFTLEQYTNMMKTAGRNFGAVTVSLSKNDFEAAKEQLTRSREQIAITVSFWRDNKKDDALKMLKTTLTKMDDLDAALSAEKVDGEAARDLARQVNAACQSCHAVYRDQDPTTKAYRLKPGSVG
jgi:cytochrome c556